MKKLTLLVMLFAFHFFRLCAQEYIPFPVNNAEWTVIHYNFRNPDGGATPSEPTSTFVYKYMLDGQDTVIDGLHYTKLFRKDVSPTAGNYAYVGAVREENKYVMLISDLVDLECYQPGVVDTIYNFNAAIADSVQAITPICRGKRLINTEDSILISGVYAKKRNLGNIAFGAESRYDYWIEGVGSALEPFIRCMPISTCACGNTFDLICLKRNDTNVYLNPLYASCDATSTITSINDQASIMKLNIYPNPSLNHQLNISYSELYNGLSARVIDYTGKTLLHQQLNRSNNIIQLPNAVQFFFLIVMNKDGKVIKTEKIYAP